jgi:drug/metabolite transporter (DMT)-like permease
MAAPAPPSGPSAAPGARSALVRGRLAAAAAGVSFGALGIFVQLAYGGGADALGLLSFRFVVAAAVLAFVSRRMGERWPGLRSSIACLLLGGGVYLTFTLLFFATLRHASPGVAALLLYLNPFVVFAWSIALGWERFRIGALVTLCVAISGLALVLADGTASRTGVVLGVLTAVVYGSYLVQSARVLRALAPWAATALICAGAGAVAVAASAVFGGELPRTPAGWGALAAMIVVSTLLALALLTLALQRIAPAEVAIIMTVEPITAVVLSAIVLDQGFTPLQALGAAITLAACVTFLRRRYADA